MGPNVPSRYVSMCVCLSGTHALRYYPVTGMGVPQRSDIDSDINSSALPVGLPSPTFLINSPPILT